MSADPHERPREPTLGERRVRTKRESAEWQSRAIAAASWDEGA